MHTAESEARRALSRLRRALEKSQRELRSLEGALSHAEGSDFPDDAYLEVAGAIERALQFTDDEAARLQEKILHAGGLEPGRVRRGH